jgi:hypothetical protein
MDETERPEDTVRRFAEEIQELRAEVLRQQEKLEQYEEAVSLWDTLELTDVQRVTDVMMIAKCVDLESNATSVGLAVNDSCDWIIQNGLLHSALQVINSINPTKTEED